MRPIFPDHAAAQKRGLISLDTISNDACILKKLWVGFSSLSEKAFQTIREGILRLISEANQHVLDSKEEQAACITIDLVQLA